MLSTRKLLTALTFTVYLITATQAFAAFPAGPTFDFSQSSQPTPTPNPPTTSSTTNQQTIFLCPTGIFGDQCTQQAGATFEGVIGNIFTYLLIAGALVAIIFLIWGGIKWITSGGDKTKVEAARHTIIGAIIGLIVYLPHS